MVFTKLLLQNILAIRPYNYEAASEPLLPKVARCIPVLLSRYTRCLKNLLKPGEQYIVVSLFNFVFAGCLTRHLTDAARIVLSKFYN